jgi:hypothetical protein
LELHRGGGRSRTSGSPGLQEFDRAFIQDGILAWEGTTLPYTIEWRREVFKDGNPIASTRVFLTCTASGASVSIINNPPLPSIPSGTDDLAGPPIPTDSQGNLYPVMMVTCDTPVYESPGGNPVENATLWAGQTWYISPEDVEAPDGSLWRAVFVSSYTPVYIPTACVAW